MSLLVFRMASFIMRCCPASPGDRLSSEWELVQLYQTSRPTVRRAVAVLKAEGLVITEQGRGAFVRPKPPVRLLVTGANYRRHRSAGLPGFNAQVTEQGRRPEQRLLEVGTVDRRVLRVGACLSLTGRYARFGRQATDGLEAWRGLDGDVELIVENDGSDPTRVEPVFGR